MAQRQSLTKGIQLEHPNAFISWNTRVPELRNAFTADGLDEPHRVADGYYTAPCQLLGALRTQVGFHFTPPDEKGVLTEVELFDNGEPEIEKSYELFHQKLVEQFGAPTREEPGSMGVALPSCEWRIGSISITHSAMDRFGPEEHLRIGKNIRAVGPPRFRGPIIGLIIGAALLLLGLTIEYWWPWLSR